MQTNQSKQLRQYARVARTLPKIIGNGSNARVRTLITAKNPQV